MVSKGELNSEGSSSFNVLNGKYIDFG